VSKATRMRVGLSVLLLACALFVSACAASRDPLEGTAAQAPCCTELNGSSAGFWLGVWHGGISPATFVVSLFSSSTGVYEVHNNGGWYNFGFYLGFTSVIGGSGSAYGRRNRDDG
jgi:hypothetical protein